MILSNYISICDAIVCLMNPLVEVVIHDIEKNTIIYINGKLSTRVIGDLSLLNQKEINNLEKVVYPKINFDGRLVKSISIVIEEKYLLCINCDVSIINKIHELSYSLLQVENQPESLFINDWQEKLHISIHSYLQDNHLSFGNLSQNNKKAIIKYLFDLGAFREKNSADYIAKILKLSRATIFKYLKEWRNR